MSDGIMTGTISGTCCAGGNPSCSTLCYLNGPEGSPVSNCKASYPDVLYLNVTAGNLESNVSYNTIISYRIKNEGDTSWTTKTRVVNYTATSNTYSTGVYLAGFTAEIELMTCITQKEYLEPPEDVEEIYNFVPPIEFTNVRTSAPDYKIAKRMRCTITNKTIESTNGSGLVSEQTEFFRTSNVSNGININGTVFGAWKTSYEGIDVVWGSWLGRDRSMGGGFYFKSSQTGIAAGTRVYLQKSNNNTIFSNWLNTTYSNDAILGYVNYENCEACNETFDGQTYDRRVWITGISLINWGRLLRFNTSGSTAPNQGYLVAAFKPTTPLTQEPESVTAALNDNRAFLAGQYFDAKLLGPSDFDIGYLNAFSVEFDIEEYFIAPTTIARVGSQYGRFVGLKVNEAGTLDIDFNNQILATGVVLDTERARWRVVIDVRKQGTIYYKAWILRNGILVYENVGPNSIYGDMTNIVKYIQCESGYNARFDFYGVKLWSGLYK